MTIAIILAAGSGTRLGADTPKQFLKVGGRTILEHTVSAFERHALIDQIAVITRGDYVEEVRQTLATSPKVRHVVAGGRERYHSTLAALSLYPDPNDILLFHDAVRPLVSERVITDCVNALQSHDAAGVGVPTTDTIWVRTSDNLISSIPPRATLCNAQTPQGFRRWVIGQAYERAASDPSFVTTDDCGVVLRYMPEVPIAIVAGDSGNIKVTYKEDLSRLAAQIGDTVGENAGV